MPKAGLEPARLAAPPPQDGVSANSTTSARLKSAISFPASVAARFAVAAAPPAAALRAAGLPVAVAAAFAVAVAAAVWRLREQQRSRRAAKSESLGPAT